MFRLKENVVSGSAIQVPAHKPVKDAKNPKHEPITINNAKKITLDEQKELLVGYVIAPPESWNELPYRAHLRYIKIDGSFVRGGFFKNFWKRNDGQQMMQLENNLNRKAQNYSTWAAPLSSIRTLYKKCDKGSSIEITSIYKKLEHQRIAINALVDAVNKMKVRIDILERKR